MIKIVSIVLFLALVGCGKCDDKKSLDHPLIVLGSITDATDLEKLVITRAVDKANAVLKSECFKIHVLTSRFTSSRGLTNAQIYDVFLSAPKTANVALFDGDYLENQVWHTQAYEGDPVRINRYFFGDVDDCASIILHEFEGHQNGFTHRDQFEDTSVPYRLNQFYDACKMMI